MLFIIQNINSLTKEKILFIIHNINLFFLIIYQIRGNNPYPGSRVKDKAKEIVDDNKVSTKLFANINPKQNSLLSYMSYFIIIGNIC